MLVTLIGDDEYHGRDGQRWLDLRPGESADVSDATARRLARDFPDRFEFDGEPGDIVDLPERIELMLSSPARGGLVRGAVSPTAFGSVRRRVMIGFDPARDDDSAVTILLYIPREGEQPPAAAASTWTELSHVEAGEVYEVPFVQELPELGTPHVRDEEPGRADLPHGLEPAASEPDTQLEPAPPAASTPPARRSAPARRSRGRRGRRS